VVSASAFGEAALKEVPVPNGNFERTQARKPGKKLGAVYACCFAKWLYSVRDGAYKLAPGKRGQGSTVARIDCVGAPGRADLLGPFMKMPAFTEFQIEVDVRQDRTTGVVALHPPFGRNQVDLALVDGPAREWFRFKTTLRTGAESEYYRITLAAIGKGCVEFDDLTLKQGAAVAKPDRVAYIIDINPREEGYQVPEKFWFKRELQAVWGYRVVIDHYRNVTGERVEELAPACIILCPSMFDKRPPGDEPARKAAHTRVHHILRTTDIPVLGICYGHQHLGRGAGTKRFAREERGYINVHALADDPLFRGLPRTFPLSQSHKRSLRDVPRGFDLLASSAACYVQIMRHRTKLQYSTQGHPERGWAGPFPQGRILLGNFFRMVEQRTLPE